MIFWKKKIPSGLADVDMPLIAHILGKCMDGSRLVRERLHPLLSEAYYEGSQRRAARVQVAQT